MPKVAVATSSELAAEAAREVIELGGNAVDAALAASALTMNTEPGVCAFSGGAIVTVWPPDGRPVSFDGYVTVPGINNPSAEVKTDTVTMAYGGGVSTLIGAGSVAVPGSPAALDAARRQFGKLPLAALLAPSIRAARQGFPLPSACHYYLNYSAEPIFARDPASKRALFPEGDTLLGAGETMMIEGLADSLSCIAENGARALYEGEIGGAIIDYLSTRGSRMTMQDLNAYHVDIREAEEIPIGGWTLAVSPPPSIGGSMLGAVMLGRAADIPLLTVLRRALQYRRRNLDYSTDLPEDAKQLLMLARTNIEKLSEFISSATVHTSASDSNGLACAITASAGYGSGEVAPGTGLWLNNCLGELELNRRGLEAGPAGARLPSNMSPSVARKGDRVIAIGSPGADRITSAMAQTLDRVLLGGKSIGDAIEAPRIHAEAALEAMANGYYAEQLYAEPGAVIEANVDVPVRYFENKSMFFGGVGATMTHGTGDAAVLDAAADSRRNGRTVISTSVVG
ncbi:MAG: gamma-glutamyltransferase [Pseudomonadota bacterium]